MWIRAKITSQPPCGNCARNWVLPCRQRPCTRLTMRLGMWTSATSLFDRIYCVANTRQSSLNSRWIPCFGEVLPRSKLGLRTTRLYSRPRFRTCSAGTVYAEPWGYLRNCLNYPLGGEIEGCVRRPQRTFRCPSSGALVSLGLGRADGAVLSPVAGHFAFPV